MINPPYYLLKYWIELYQADCCDELFFHKIKVMEEHYGSIDNAYAISEWYEEQ